MNIPLVIGCLSKQVEFSLQQDCGGLFLLRTGLVMEVEFPQQFRLPQGDFYVAFRGERPVGYVLSPREGVEQRFGGYYVLLIDRQDTFSGQEHPYDDENVVVSRFDMSLLLTSKKHVTRQMHESIDEEDA